MKKFSKGLAPRSFSEVGFTLIELLIVIALLGSLAVGLLAALDPLEQIRKGSDTGIRNTVIEVQGAITRFYAIKSQMPWCDPAVIPPTAASCPDPASSGTAAPTQVNLTTTVTTGFNSATFFTAIDQVVNAGELKVGFTTLASAQLTKIFVTGTSGLAAGTSPIVAVCYKPTAKSFQADPNTKYCANGVVQGVAGCSVAANACKSTGGATDCFWCIQ